MQILIISGGDSSERKISLISAKGVKKALEKNNFTVRQVDFRKVKNRLEEVAGNFDVIFPVMHGFEGEDGALYKRLQKIGKPYVGSDPRGAKTAFNKILFKRYSDKNKIRTAKWKIVKSLKDILNFGLPCVLKAEEGGSSREVVILNIDKDLKKKEVKKLLNSKYKCYVEEKLSGDEITVGILGDKILPVIEIVPPKGKWFDYQFKYSGESKEIPFAPSVSKKVQLQAQDTALRIHKDLKLKSYSRSDFIVVDNIPYILEINTPGGVGMTPESLFPKAALAYGIDFPQLVRQISEMAIAEQ